MNRKYSIIATVLMFLSTQVSFAAQMTSKDRSLYSLIVSMSNNETLTQASLDRNNITIDRAVQIIETHKKILEKQRTSLQSSYVPGLLRLISGSLGLTSFIGGVAAGTSAVASYMILNQPISKGEPIMIYPEWLAYVHDLYRNISATKIFYTEKYVQSLRGAEKLLFETGTRAPLLLGGSLVAWGLYKYLANKVTGYTIEIARLTEEINRDAAILETLRALRSRPEFQ